MKRLLLLTATFLPLASFCQPQEVKDILPGVFSSDPSRMTVFNYNLYFFAGDEGNGYELRSYNGTSVKLIKDIYSGTKDCAPKSPGKKMAVLGNKLYCHPLHPRLAYHPDACLHHRQYQYSGQ